MKVTVTGPLGMKIQAVNPDERMKEDVRQRIQAAVREELQAFAEECAVTLRQLKPGESKAIESRPVVVTLSIDAEPVTA